MFYNDKKGFDCQRFEAERFGVGRGKMGFQNWRDLAWYVGMGGVVHANERTLRRGEMTQKMYDALCRLYGKDEMDKYFPTTETPKKNLTEDEKYVEGLAMGTRPISEQKAWREENK